MIRPRLCSCPVPRAQPGHACAVCGGDAPRPFDPAATLFSLTCELDPGAVALSYFERKRRAMVEGYMCFLDKAHGELVERGLDPLEWTLHVWTECAESSVRMAGRWVRRQDAEELGAQRAERERQRARAAELLEEHGRGTHDHGQAMAVGLRGVDGCPACIADRRARPLPGTLPGVLT